VSRTKRVPWSRDEFVVACGLYFTLPFGQMHAGNPRVIQVAQLLGRTISRIEAICRTTLPSGRSGIASASALGARGWEPVPRCCAGPLIARPECPAAAQTSSSGSFEQWHAFGSMRAPLPPAARALIRRGALSGQLEQPLRSRLQSLPGEHRHWRPWSPPG